MVKYENLIDDILNPIIDLFCLKNQKDPSYINKEKARFYLERKLTIQGVNFGRQKTKEKK